MVIKANLNTELAHFVKTYGDRARAVLANKRKQCSTNRRVLTTCAFLLAVLLFLAFATLHGFNELTTVPIYVTLSLLAITVGIGIFSPYFGNSKLFMSAKKEKLVYKGTLQDLELVLKAQDVRTAYAEWKIFYTVLDSNWLDRLFLDMNEDIRYLAILDAITNMNNKLTSHSYDERTNNLKVTYTDIAGNVLTEEIYCPEVRYNTELEFDELCVEEGAVTLTLKNIKK